MGWGNVSHALALANFRSRKPVSRIRRVPISTRRWSEARSSSDGSSIPLSGVLQLRAGGMGWAIAHTYGTTMGAVNRAIKAPSSLAGTPTPTSSPVRTTGGLEQKQPLRWIASRPRAVSRLRPRGAERASAMPAVHRQPRLRRDLPPPAARRPRQVLDRRA